MPTFIQLREGHICGAVDSYGAVHCVFTGKVMGYHAELFPGMTHCRWRWNFDQGIYWIGDQKVTDEQAESIRNMITKKFRIKFWDNGFTDLDHFNARVKKDREKEKET